MEYYFGYKIKGDTIINEVTYKKVYYRKLEPVNSDLNNPVEGPFYIEEEFLFGVIRDDTFNKKVYAIRFCDIGGGECVCDEEFLLYDFSMLVGGYYNSLCIVIDGTEFYLEELTTEFLFGKDRLIQSINGFWGYIYEGVGGDTGLFYPVGVPLGCPCASLDLYCIGSDEECLNDFLLATDSYELQNKFRVYPNPTENIVMIESNNDIAILSVKIYNIVGNLLFVEQNNINQIDISNLNPSVLFVKIETEKGSFLQKIIKI